VPSASAAPGYGSIGNGSTVTSMNDDPSGVARGCLLALVVDAAPVMAGWQAWRLLHTASGT
jgi:hypothetical protein